MQILRYAGAAVAAAAVVARTRRVYVARISAPHRPSSPFPSQGRPSTPVHHINKRTENLFRIARGPLITPASIVLCICMVDEGKTTMSGRLGQISTRYFIQMECRYIYYGTFY